MRLIASLRNCSIKVCLAFLAIVGMAGLVPAAHAAAGNNNVKIVAWYGAGNLTKSEYSRDTIILFNPTTQDIDMTGWSIQTGSTSGSFTTIYNFYQLPLAATPAQIAHPVIKAGGFFALAGSGVAYNATAATTCNTAHCMLADTNYDAQLGKIGTAPTTADNDLSSTAVVAALVSNSVAVGTTCTTATANSALVDLVGIEAADGSSPVTCYAGGGPAGYVPNNLNAGSTTSVHGTTYAFATIRKNRCVDTFNNYADFTLGYIDFKNSTSPVQPCPSGNQITMLTQATPESPAVGASFLATAKVTPPSGRTIASVKVDISSLTANTVTTYTPPNYVTMYDDGTNGDVKAGDGIYTATLTMPATTPTQKPGQLLGVNAVVTDSVGDIMTSDVQMGSGTTVPGPGSHDLLMIGFYGAGNLAYSQYGRDTIILFNPTQGTIDTGGYSFQAGSTTAAFSKVSYVLPSHPVPPGGFYAVAASGAAYISSPGCSSTYVPSPCNTTYAYDYQLGTIEAAGVVNTTANIISSTNTTYALVKSTTVAIGSNCPLHSVYIADIIGNQALDGTTTIPCYPGTAPAYYIPTTYNGAATLINGVKYPFADVRGNPCANTYDLSMDWQLGYIDFENSASTPRPCPSGQPLLITASASPQSLGLSDNLTITAVITPASNSSTDMVTADLTNIGLGSVVTLSNTGQPANTYVTTVKPASTNGFSIGTNGVQIPALTVTATDTANNRASTTLPVTIVPGTILLSSATSSITVKSGGVAIFPLTLQALHGFTGIVTISCTGSPNTNSLGVPVGMQCVTTPPEITLAVNASATCQLGISAGTTFSAGPQSRSFFGALITMLSLMVLGVGIWRRKHLPVALTLALLTLGTLGTTGCETNAGMNNTGAAPGTYTFVVTATDTTTGSTVHSTINLTVIVQ